MVLEEWGQNLAQKRPGLHEKFESVHFKVLGFDRPLA